MSRFCTECGHALEDGATRCPKCGAPVEDVAEPAGNETETEYYETERPWYETDIFHAIISPFTRNFDNGKLFLGMAKAIIIIVAALSLLSAPAMSLSLYESDLLEYSDTDLKILVFICCLVVLLLSLLSYSYWMKRFRRIDSIFDRSYEYVVIPIGTYLIQWIGEWIAILFCTVGICEFLLSLSSSSSYMLNYAVVKVGIMSAIITVVAGFMTAFVCRLVAERIRAIASIANNTDPKNRHNVRRKGDNYTDDANETLNNVLYFVIIVLTLALSVAALF